MLKSTEEYMAQMDSAMNDKELMLNYIVGDTVMDMGCGSGGLLDSIKNKYPHINRIGMDKDLTFMNHRMFHRLTKLEGGNKKLQLIEDDVVNLSDHVSTGEIDTFIFSSILHEVYSYSGFNLGTVRQVLVDAIRLLPVGGRLIIRDGVKPESDKPRLLTFVNPQDVQKVFKFCKDFKGSNIIATTISDDTVSMGEWDAMEFLYTYTWGEQHYEREIQEMYGLFQPRDYIDFVVDCAEVAKCELWLVTYNHYLQEGYNQHLSKRVDYTDINGTRMRLPDSNGLFIFEKL